jgi:hypothetical protein
LTGSNLNFFIEFYHAMKNILIFLLLAFPSLLTAQQTATTLDGRKVLLFEDYTWQYAQNLTPDISDDCDDYVAFLEDKSVLSGKVKVSVNTVFVGDNLDDVGFEIIMIEDVEHVLIDLQIEGESACFGEGEMGIFTFEGNHDVKLQNIISKNCEGQAQFLIELKNKENLKRFSENKLKKIRIFHQNGSVEKKVGDLATRSFLKTFQCMLGR